MTFSTCLDDEPTVDVPFLTMAELVASDDPPEDPDKTPAPRFIQGACGVCSRPFAFCTCTGWDDEPTKETETP